MLSRQTLPANWSVGTRISVISFLLMGSIIAALVALLTVTTADMLEERATQGVANELRSVANTVEMFNKSVSSSARSFGRIFRNTLPGAFELDSATTVDIGGKATPSLKLDGKVLNLDFGAPDAFTAQTRGNATIFAVDGDDFVRVTTSVKKKKRRARRGHQPGPQQPGLRHPARRRHLHRPRDPVRQAVHHAV